MAFGLSLVVKCEEFDASMAGLLGVRFSLTASHNDFCQRLTLYDRHLWRGYCNLFIGGLFAELQNDLEPFEVWSDASWFVTAVDKKSTRLTLHPFHEQQNSVEECATEALSS